MSDNKYSGYDKCSLGQERIGNKNRSRRCRKYDIYIILNLTIDFHGGQTGVDNSPL